MNHVNPPQEALRDILNRARTIAVVGASSKTGRPAWNIMRQLLSAGYTVIPVNPRESEVLGQKAYGTLTEVPDEVDVVNVFRRAEETPAIAAEAAEIGAKVLWLQQGIHSDEAAESARDAGLTVVTDLCIGATHTQLGIPQVSAQPASGAGDP